MTFKELTIDEHSLLMKIFLKEDFKKDHYEKELKSLYDKTYLGINPQNGFYINSRGVAFLQQQRNPFVDIKRVIEHTPLNFKYELCEALIKAIKMEESINQMYEKNSKIHGRLSKQPS